MFTEVFEPSGADLIFDFVVTQVIKDLGSTESTTAVTFTRESHRQGVILFNNGYHKFSLDQNPSNAKDLHYTALHEIGHFLGLCHSSNDGSVMYFDYRPNWTLSQYDIAGIKAIYADVKVKNEFINPDGSTTSGEKVSVDDYEFDTEILPNKELRKAFVPNTTHKLEAKDLMNINGRNWKFNPPNNRNGGWYKNGAFLDESSQVYNVVISEGTYKLTIDTKQK